MKTRVGEIDCKNGKSYDIYKVDGKKSEYGFYSKNEKTPGLFITNESFEKLAAYVANNNGGFVKGIIPVITEPLPITQTEGA